MSNLKIYKKPELIVLESKKKLREYTDIEFNTKCANLVYYLLNLLGVSDGKTEHHTTLIKFIKATSDHYSFEEIVKAFDLYVSHQLNIKVFQQLNAVVFGNVMKAFSVYKNQKLRIYKQQNSIKKEVELSENEKNQIMQKATLKIFAEYKQTEELKGITHHIYDYLDNKGLMPKENEYKISIYKKAKKIILQEKRNEYLLSQNVPQNNIINEQIDSIKNNNNKQVINFSKKIILEEYFKKIISTQIELKDLLK